MGESKFWKARIYFTVAKQRLFDNYNQPLLGDVNFTI